MPDAKKWDDLTKTRAKQLAENRSRRTERELEIERKLKTPVSLQVPQPPAERSARAVGEAGRGEHASRRQGPRRRRRHQRHAGDDRPDARDLAEERAEPDPRAAALELRHQGRSAQDHQRTTARRRNLSGHLQRGRPGDSDSELRAQRPHGPGRRVERRPTTWPAAAWAAWAARAPAYLASQDGIAGHRHRRSQGAGADESAHARQHGLAAARPAPANPCHSVPAAWAAVRRPTSIRSST